MSGEWKSPARRATADEGRKEESLADVERMMVELRGRTMIGICVLRASIIWLSSTVGAWMDKVSMIPVLRREVEDSIPDGSRNMRAVYNGVDADETRLATMAEGRCEGSKASDTV